MIIIFYDFACSQPKEWAEDWTLSCDNSFVYFQESRIIHSPFLNPYGNVTKPKFKNSNPWSYLVDRKRKDMLLKDAYLMLFLL